MRANAGRVGPVLRGLLWIDSAVFLVAALLNWGIHIPLRFVTLAFIPAVWQAGIGEAVVGCSLVAAGATGRRRLAWIGFWFSALGIGFGLRSHAVQGAARQVHYVLVPLAIILLVLLVVTRGREPMASAGRRST